MRAAGSAIRMPFTWVSPNAMRRITSKAKRPPTSTDEGPETFPAVRHDRSPVAAAL
jgi:hypothetical protein